MLVQGTGEVIKQHCPAAHMPFNCRLSHNAAFATTHAASHVIGLCANAHADFLKPLIMVKRMTMVRRAARTGGP